MTDLDNDNNANNTKKIENAVRLAVFSLRFRVLICSFVPLTILAAVFSTYDSLFTKSLQAVDFSELPEI